MFHYLENGILVCSALEVPGLRHGFGTRRGGVSTGCFSSMNLGYNRGDLPERVSENYRLFHRNTDTNQEKLVYVRQIHSDLLHRADAGRSCLRQDGDGVVTDVPGLPLACYYADCMPVLLYDPARRAVGAIHSGWRGTVQDILPKAVAKLQADYGCKPENLIAAVGPSIGPCHMEVGPEVRAQFLERGYDTVQPRDDSLYLDLWETAHIQLRGAGLLEENIHIARICTYCEQELFFSHRRMGERRGNHAAVIQLTGEASA